MIVMIIALISIWLSLAWGLVILFSAVHFWFKHSDFRKIRFPYYPKVDDRHLPIRGWSLHKTATKRSLIWTTHMIVWTLLLQIIVPIVPMKSVWRLKHCQSMPDVIWPLSIEADRWESLRAKWRFKDGKSRLYLRLWCRCHAWKECLYFRKEVLKDPERHVASFRPAIKTRNANQNLTRINQEIVVTQRFIM